MTRMPYCIGLILGAALALPALAAPRLSAGLSEARIEVRAGFSGARLLVFGALEDGPQIQGRLRRDVVITLKGPPRRIVLWEKARIAGIWTNYDQTLFDRAPAFYALAASRPLNQITSLRLRRRLNLGADHAFLPPAQIAPAARAAFLRLMRAQGRFPQQAANVDFLSGRLFRAQFTLPAAAPVGNYEAKIYLIERGRLRDAQTLSLRLDKTGFNQSVFAFAHDAPLLYGAAAVLLALAVGWIASVLFRRR